jgi:hypothetical protein
MPSLWLHGRLLKHVSYSNLLSHVIIVRKFLIDFLLLMLTVNLLWGGGGGDRRIFQYLRTVPQILKTS